MLITGKKPAPFRFHRQLRWEAGRWLVSDDLQAEDWRSVQSVAIGGDQTSIYVVMSRTFQMGQLLPWLDLTAQAQALSPGQVLHWERKL